MEQYEIVHNKCIDDELMIKCFSEDKQLMDFIGHPPENIQLELLEERVILRTRIRGKDYFAAAYPVKILACTILVRINVSIVMHTLQNDSRS